MHFGKTFAQLLLTLPPELSGDAIQYHQLKKLIHEVVHELASLGLSPEIIQDLSEVMEQPDASQEEHMNEDTESSGSSSCNTSLVQSPATPSLGDAPPPKVVYELFETSDGIEPQLRLKMSSPLPLQDSLRIPPHALQRILGSQDLAQTKYGPAAKPDVQELLIQLRSDKAFFGLLCSAFHTLSAHIPSLQSAFSGNLEALSRSIARAARPLSTTTTSFSACSRTSPIKSIDAPCTPNRDTDLYTWREIFQIYMETEVFESAAERTRGERAVEDTEERWQLFSDRVARYGPDGKFRMAQSKQDFEMFMQLNRFILDVKKFHSANAEATRKILKKFARRTALPLPQRTPASPVETEQHSSSLDLITIPSAQAAALPRMLVQSITETLLPVIPHIQDYACLICTSIAFKPIRLSCGHLFCVRCLVKMQRRRQGCCPMCRAQSVLTANISNVDWALMNLMRDWFPLESGEKQKQNEREVVEEMKKDICVVM